MRTQSTFARFVTGSGLPALALLLATVSGPALAATTDQILHQFLDTNDGLTPDDLAADSAGNLFGVTQFGGKYGTGTVFELTPSNGSWTFKTIYQGAGVPAGISVDVAGNLYINDPVGPLGYGTIFELVPTGNGGWKIGRTYNFTGGADGAQPNKVVIDAAGNVWGSAAEGGNGNGDYGGGTVFELSPTKGGWTDNTIYTFQGGSDGAFPRSNVALAKNGDIYGEEPAHGTVFRIHHAGKSWKHETLYTFPSGEVPNAPAGTLVLDRADNVYGTTTAFASLVFQVSPPPKHSMRGTPWTYTTIGDFGTNGSGGLVFDKSGNLYGATAYGGDAPCACGEIFKLVRGKSGPWKQKVVWNFTDRPDASTPNSDIVLGADGMLYGASSGGGQGYGTVYGMAR